MKSTILRSGAALACALGLAACGGGGDLNLQGGVYNVTRPGLVLQNNGGNDTEVGVNPNTGLYDFFRFSNAMSTDDSFNITVKSIPANAESCVVNNGSGHINYYTYQQASVQCTFKQWPLIVQVRGLNANSTGLVLVNGSDKQAVTPDNSGNIAVTMAKVNQDALYAVKVLSQPAGLTCNVTGGDAATNNGSGTVGSGPVQNVVVTCS